MLRSTVFNVLYSFHALASSGEGNEGDFTVVETTRTAAPRKAKCSSSSLYSYVVIHTKTSRTYNTAATNASGAANNKTRNQQKKNSSQYQRRNYDSLHIPSIPVRFNLCSLYRRSNPPGSLSSRLSLVIWLS